jgi:HEAT repeat protein
MSNEGMARERGSIDYDLRNPDEEVRRLAVERLTMLPEDEALPRLMESLGDESWRVRKSAVARVAHLHDAALSVRALIQGLADGENSGRRNACVEALVRRGPLALPHLVEALGDPDSGVRQQVVDVMAGIGDESVAPAVLRALGDADSNVSGAAADALGVLGGDEASAALRDLALDDQSDPLVRISALRALSRLEVAVDPSALEAVLDDPILRPAAFGVLYCSDDPRAVDVLLKGLSLRARSSRDAAILSLVAALGRSDGADEAALIARIREVAAGESWLVDATVESLDGAALTTRLVLIQFLGVLGDPGAAIAILEASRDEALREVAHSALESLGTPTEVAIEAAWQSLSLELRREACAVLGRIHGEVGDRLLLELIEGADASLRTEASVAVGLRRCADAIPALIRRLEFSGADDHEAREERDAIVEALGSIGDSEENPAARTQLVELLADRVDGASDEVRYSIACVLRRVARDEDARQVSLLLKDPSAQVRRAAVEALSELDSSKVSEPLRLALADESSAVRIAAARALGCSESETALEDLERLTADEDPRLRAAAVRALGEQGQRVESRRERALVRIEVSLGDEAAVAIAGAEALRELGGAAAARAAVRLLDHEAPEVVQAAVSCIAANADREALVELLPLISHTDWSVRADVVAALGDRRYERAVPPILRRLETEQDSFVRETILAALRRLEA